MSAASPPSRFAYIEFADEATVPNAQLLNDSLFRGRQLKVRPMQALSKLPPHNAVESLSNHRNIEKCS